MTELTEIAEGVLMVRTLLSGDALHSTVHVINLSDPLYDFERDDLLGKALLVEVCKTNSFSEVS